MRFSIFFFSDRRVSMASNITSTRLRATKANTIKADKMRPQVNILPLDESALTSPKPTVLIVMIVI